MDDSANINATLTLETNKKDVKCEICNETAAKYRCPRCSQRTCSLQCVNKHKINSGCNGKRDKTAFVSIKKFTDSNLLSDYCLLEDIGRKCHSSQRDFLRNRHYKPKGLMKLIRHAESQGIELRTMPFPMSKRKNNRTIFLFRTKEILWQIEWSFPHADTATFFDKKQKETETLEDLLIKYLDPKVADALVLHQLRSYADVGLAGCTLVMKAEGLPVNKVRYHVLDCKLSITDNLKGKCIVEYPTILVVFNSHLNKYTTLSKEEEHEMWLTRRKTNFSRKQTYNPYKQTNINDTENNENCVMEQSTILECATASKSVIAPSVPHSGASIIMDTLDAPANCELLNNVIPNGEL